jgi:LacI family transcriptional regulator
MRVTIGDVALHAGVSKTTVSRVLNDRGEVDAETARRVRDVIDRLGYVPSARAVGLAIGRTSTVGMLVPSLGWPWMSQIVQGVADILEERRYGLLLYTCTRGTQSLEQFASGVAAHSCDGLLVVVPEDGMPYITSMYERGLPVVMIDDRGFGPALPRRVREPGGWCVRCQAPARPGPTAADRADRTAGVRLRPGAAGRLR